MKHLQQIRKQQVVCLRQIITLLMATKPCAEYIYFMAGNTWHGNTLSISHMYIPRIKVQVSVWPDHVNESQLVLADLENNNASNI